MHKILFAFVLGSISIILMANPVLEDNGGDSPTVRMLGSSSATPPVLSGVNNSLYLESPGSNTTESNPIIVYAPLGTPNAAGNSNLNYTFYSIANTTDTGSMFNLNGSTFFGVFEFTFNVALNGESGKYLNFALQDNDGDWNVISGSTEEGGQAPITSEGANIRYLSLNRLCSSLDTNVFNCDSSFNNDLTSPSATGEFNLYAYIGGQTDTTVVPDENGVFYQIKFSNKVVQTVGVFLYDLKKGDEQLIAELDGFGFSDEILQTYAYLVTENTSGLSDEVASSSTANNTMKDLSLTLGSLQALDTTNTSGLISIKNLTNDTQYAVRMVFCDKYGFCSRLSNRLLATPESLESLLTKQSCFLLTAGFEGEHKVIDFFRVFRDKVMSKFFFGQAFTQVYYATAPKLTGWIAQHEWMKASIRVFGTSAYFVFKYWWVSLSALFLSLIFLLRGKESYGRS